MLHRSRLLTGYESLGVMADVSGKVQVVTTDSESGVTGNAERTAVAGRYRLLV